MPTTMTILTEADLRQCVPLDLTAVDMVAEGFRALAGEGVQMPPILSMAIPRNNGEVDVKTAFVPGFDAFAMKVSPGFFDNPKIGLPSLNGLMVLLSARTGLVEALMLDNGYLTAVRTAAAGAVAARALARKGPLKAGVLGAGEQARLQMQALALVRDLTEVSVWARDTAKAEAYAKEMSGKLGVRFRTTATPEHVVRDSDVVVTTTPSREPLIRAEWLHPGLHITAMGSDASEKNELEPAVLKRADLFVTDRTAQCALLGELHHAISAGLDVPAVELGVLVREEGEARPSEEAVTVCDLTGTGVQDTVIANHAYAAAQKAGLGREFHA
ncbi:cyclodeaminase [Caenispirillum salinarum]|uniref:cyclodeaminase n=1 Tax=Caenispirillum salinarum TaxID=859058 RepID=UPI00384C2F57